MFYTYSQNNSGGSFHYDERAGISHYVIIEAENADEANEKAEYIGLYFDGDADCSCCGNRWYAAYDEHDGSVEPEIYGKPADLFGTGEWDHKWMKGYEAFVHYNDGRMGMIWDGRKELTQKGLD